MDDQISALVDGEIGEREAASLLTRMKADEGLRRQWDDYQLIGDALRGHVAPAMAGRLAARLDAEPTVLAPHRHDRLKSLVLPAISAAAGAAAVAIVAWGVLPAAAPSPTPGIAQVGNPVTTSVAGGARLVAAPQQQASSTEPAITEVVREMPLAGVDDYLLAHQRFSPANAMQGVAPYVRTVSNEEEAR